MIIKGSNGRRVFVVVTPVAACSACPYYRVDSTGHLKSCTESSGYDVIKDDSTIPDWCPALAEAQEELPGAADWDFLRNDALPAEEL